MTLNVTYDETSLIIIALQHYADEISNDIKESRKGLQNEKEKPHEEQNQTLIKVINRGLCEMVKHERNLRKLIDDLKGKR